MPMASGLRRPLMLVHGLADDNVVIAHTCAYRAHSSRPVGRTRCCHSPG